jgi:type II secretion system protein I
MNRRSRNAFTLLEVILALAILAGAVAALGELIRTGMLNAQAARDLTRAELVAETVVSEVMAGALAPSASNTPWDEDSRWLYSVSTESASQAGLLALTVTVVRDAPPAQHPVSYTIKRWMVDPGVEQQSEANAQATEQNAASGSSPSGSSTGTGS